MAILTTSAGILELRNSIGATTYSRNHYGAFARQRVNTPNPNTSYQQATRVTFALMQTHWLQLTDDQRKSWSMAAPDFPYRNALGRQIILTGRALYTALNSVLSANAFPKLTLPPLPTQFPLFAITKVTAVNGTGSVSLTMTPGALPANMYLYVNSTKAISPDINNVDTRLRFMDVYHPSSGIVDFSAAFNARFPAPTLHNRITVRAQLFNSLTGELSLPFYRFGTVF